MTDLTFKINGHDYSDLVEKRKYKTKLIPIIGRQYTDLNKVTHTTIARHQGELTVGIRVAPKSRITAFCADLQTAPVTVMYYSFQLGTVVTQTMMPDASTMQDAFNLAGERWNETSDVTFTEE